MQMWKIQDAPVLAVFGQSNAHGHGTRLEESQRITEPLANVWGLARRENQRYGLDHVVWSGFTTEGMNLGETQDHTCCLASEFSRKWQAAIGRGAQLPDLYVIQISVGAQGIAEVEDQGLNMWYPRREPIMTKGPQGIVDVSLYPLAVEILRNAVRSLKGMGKNPVFLGLHWNQWETEVQTGAEAIRYAKANYEELFDGFRKAIGKPCPIYLYRPLSDVYQNPSGVEALTRTFCQLVAEHDDMRMIDLTESPLWEPARPDKGIFMEDLVHYHEQTHRWFAQCQWNDVFHNE